MVTTGERRWAILVGASQYQDFTKLRFSARDAAEFSRALTDKLGFTRETMFLLSDAPEHEADLSPTRNDIWRALSSLAKPDSPFYRQKGIEPIGEDDLFVFYFSGHGLRTSHGDEYLLSIDASELNVPETAVNFGELGKVIANLPCRHKVLFVDACRSEFEDEGAKSVAQTIEGFGHALDREGVATFYSCDPRDRSYELDDYEHGSFTYCLLDAVKNPNVNTLGELDEFLASRVPKINVDNGKRPQKPFLVPNPADMLKLSLFAVQERKLDLAELMEQVTRKADEKEIDYELWDRVTTFIEDAQRGAGEHVHIRKALLRRWCAGDLTVDQFVPRWYRTERRDSVRESKPQVDMTPTDAQRS